MATASSNSGLAPPLEGSVVDLAGMRADALRLLVNSLRPSPGASHDGGTITLVLDAALSGPLALLTSTSVLREHGVEKIHHLGAELLLGGVPNTDRVVYIARASPANATYIAEHVRVGASSSSSPVTQYSCFLVPSCTLACERVFEERGVMGDLEVEGFPLRWIPMEEDVLSMQVHGSRASDALTGADVHEVAGAVDELVSRFGVDHSGMGGGGNGMGIKAKGAVSAEVIRLLGRMRTERGVRSRRREQQRHAAGIGGGSLGRGSSEPAAAPSASSNAPPAVAGVGGATAGGIDCMVLLDRSVDLATPLATQHTYEGLIDELIGIRNGAVEEAAAMQKADDEASVASAAGGKRSKIALNGGDSLYREVRDLRFPEAAMLLHQRNLDMNDAYKSVKAQSGSARSTGSANDVSSTVESVSDLKAFVKRLKAGALAQLERHTNIATRVDAATKARHFRDRIEIEQSILSGEDLEHCAEYLETQMCKQEPVLGVLRLLCLFSIANGGMRQRTWDFVRREFLQSYGYHHVVTLNNLVRAGLIKRQDGPRTGFPALRRPLRLVDAGGGSSAGSSGGGAGVSGEEDINYIYSGYAPLSVRLVQVAVTTGLAAAGELLKQIPGETLELTMESDEYGMPVEAPPRPVHARGDRRPLVLVVFVGGVTFAEISALRYLSVKEIVSCDFLIATTALVNGSSLLSAFVDEDAVPSDIATAGTGG